MGTLPNACPKPTPRVLTKLKKRAAEAKQIRHVWAEVDRRDEYCCRVCKRFCNPRAISVLEKIHRHHLDYRSQGGMDVESNLVSLCARCHGLVHDSKLRLSGNAEERNELGKLAGVKVERLTESGWQVERMC